MEVHSRFQGWPARSFKNAPLRITAAMRRASSLVPLARLTAVKRLLLWNQELLTAKVAKHSREDRKEILFGLCVPFANFAVKDLLLWSRNLSVRTHPCGRAGSCAADRIPNCPTRACPPRGPIPGLAASTSLRLGRAPGTARWGYRA